MPYASFNTPLQLWPYLFEVGDKLHHADRRPASCRDRPEIRNVCDLVFLNDSDVSVVKSSQLHEVFLASKD
jgi:hypothetical protein